MTSELDGHSSGTRTESRGEIKPAAPRYARPRPDGYLALAGELAADALGSALNVGGINWDGLVDKAKARGLAIGGCAFVALYRALDQAKPATTRSLVDVRDPGRAALERLRAEFSGPRWELADGTVL